MNQYYENAFDKGFHEDDTFGPDGTPDARTRIVFAGLVTTEWREQRIDRTTGVVWGILDETSPAPGKPVGELSEWADIWIRCADSLGACGESLTGTERSPDVRNSVVCSLVAQAIECARKGDNQKYAECLRGIMKYSALKMAILSLTTGSCPSALEAIAIKHAYNTTRPRKHGKLA